MMQNADGESLSLTILFAQGKSKHKAITDLYLGALKCLDGAAEVATVDNAQHVERTGKFDFDVTYYLRSLFLSTGNEQQFYWGSPSASMECSRHIMGAQSPAVDAMFAAGSKDDFVAAVRGLDRALITGRFVIAFWQFTTCRIVHVKEMKYPENLPIYRDSPYYMPEVWWWEN